MHSSWKECNYHHSLQTARLSCSRQPRLQNSPFFAYSSTREQSNKRSGMRLKTESETGEHTPYERVRLARFARVRLLREALPFS